MSAIVPGFPVRRPAGRSCGALLMLILLAGPRGAAPAAALERPLEVGFSSFSFAHNLEYTGNAANYRQGETFFGQHLYATATTLLGRTVSITGGAFLGLTFGSEPGRRWDDVEPVLRLDLRLDDRLRVTFGNLGRERHEFLLALFDEVVRYQRPTEHGVEAQARLGRFSQGAWINWQALNTGDHREKFDVGSIAAVDLAPVRLDAQVHFIHRGGQLHSVGPVTDNTALALGGTVGLGLLDAALDGSGVTVHWLHSRHVADRMDDSRSLSGEGVTATAFAGFGGWHVFFSWWAGEDFFAEDGHPFYRAEEFLMAGFQRTWLVEENVAVDLGFAGYSIDESRPHTAWLTISAASGPGSARIPPRLY